MSVDCTSKVHVVEEINEVILYEIHVVNSIIRESPKESFVVEHCNREIAVNEFGKQTQEILVCDVVTIENVSTLSRVEEKSVLVTMGLQEGDAIAVEIMQQIKYDCGNGIVATEGNERMLEWQ